MQQLLENFAFNYQISCGSMTNHCRGLKDEKHSTTGHCSPYYGFSQSVKE
jgi:hypothetical protein